MCLPRQLKGKQQDLKPDWQTESEPQQHAGNSSVGRSEGKKFPAVDFEINTGQVAHGEQLQLMTEKSLKLWRRTSERQSRTSLPAWKAQVWKYHNQDKRLDGRLAGTMLRDANLSSAQRKPTAGWAVTKMQLWKARSVEEDTHGFVHSGFEASTSAFCCHLVTFRANLEGHFWAELSANAAGFHRRRKKLWVWALLQFAATESCRKSCPGPAAHGCSSTCVCFPAVMQTAAHAGSTGLNSLH